MNEATLKCICISGLARNRSWEALALSEGGWQELQNYPQILQSFLGAIEGLTRARNFLPIQCKVEIFPKSIPHALAALLNAIHRQF